MRLRIPQGERGKGKSGKFESKGDVPRNREKNGNNSEKKGRTTGGFLVINQALPRRSSSSFDKRGERVPGKTAAIFIAGNEFFAL